MASDRRGQGDSADSRAEGRPIRRVHVERLADNLIETARELERLGGEDELDSGRIIELARYAARAARRIARRSGWSPGEGDRRSAGGPAHKGTKRPAPRGGARRSPLRKGKAKRRSPHPSARARRGGKRR